MYILDVAVIFYSLSLLEIPPDCDVLECNQMFIELVSTVTKKNKIKVIKYSFKKIYLLESEN